MNTPIAISSVIRNGEPFPVRVEFLSDWACGTGTSRHGSVNRCVERDQDGLPMLRGKTLVGVLRDAAETVATGLDNGDYGVWQQWIEVVFGGQPGAAWQAAPHVRPTQEPRPAALQGRPLRVAETVRAAIAELAHPEVVRDAMVLLRPGVRIDPATGVAVDDMFRIEERASAGLIVEADWQLSFAGLAVAAPVPWETEFLLLAAARLVEAVGGKRRRGAGRCTVRLALPGVDHTRRLDELLDQLDAAAAPTAVTARPPTTPAMAFDAARTTPPVPWAGGPADPPRHRHDLRITAVTPLLVPRGVIGNMVFAAQAVPGTSLVPMLAQALGDRSTELITSGRVVVTDATLEIDGRRSLPVPRALHGQKGIDTRELVNVLRCPRRKGQRLKPASGFCVLTGDGIDVARPTLVTHAHAMVSDDSQRPDEESGGFYLYEAIAPGTVLRAEVWLPDGVTLDEVQLTKVRALGRSKKDDYGSVKIEVRPPANPGVPPGKPPSPDQDLLVWLTSDLLLRGDVGQPVTDAQRLAAVLGERLGVALALPEATGRDIPPAALVGHSRLDSWQTRWSLPRPSLVGLAAGSVIRFTMRGTPAAQAYQRVLAGGVGERTAEGFGRLLLQPPLLAREIVPVRERERDRDGNAVTRSAPRLTEPQQRLLTELIVRGWSRELRRIALVRARDSRIRGALLPKNTTSAQLGTLRTLADRLAADGDATALRAWTASTRSSLRRRVWQKELLDKLDQLATSPGALWELLDTTPPATVEAQLHLPALAWLLAEVARTQAAEQNKVQPDPTPAQTEEVPA